jgi:hypothetical protein
MATVTSEPYGNPSGSRATVQSVALFPGDEIPDRKTTPP